jgi:hypothetical protein
MKTPYNNNADAVMECVHGVLTTIAHLAGCTPGLTGESLKWTLIIQNVDTKRNLHQLLKGKQLYSALHGVYTEVLYDLMAVLKDSAAKVETATAMITAPLSIKEFCE